MATETLSPLEWAAKWIANIGWPILLTFFGVSLWKIRGRMDRFLAAVKLSDERLTETQETAAKVLKEVQLITTNHMAHLETKTDAMALEQKESNRLLASMDKTLTLLLDRSSRNPSVMS